MKKKLSPRVTCLSCGNNFVKIYLAQTGGNKRPIGLFCVHCDTPRNPEGWFTELKFKKIKETEEKRKHMNFDNKIRCSYCGGIDYKKDKDKFIYHKHPIYEKDQTTVKKYVEKEYGKNTVFHCKNLKCKTKSHKGIWSVFELV